ncbi:hypothetical protein BKA62DRAFT_719142, partial [Auriculariales sp. MPI-PUGE-AT-0066]
MGVDWNDPEVLSKSRRALILFAHAVVGLYTWEFIVTLDYDIALIRRKRKLNAGAVLYLFPRYSTAFAGIVLLRMCNAMTEDVNCRLWNHLLHVSGYVSNTFTSGLLYARVCALSGWNRCLIWGLGLAYITAWAVAIEGMLQSDAIYIQDYFLCQPIELYKHRMNLSYLFAFDLVCLICMMVCLLRMHRGTGGGIWMMLMQQGVVYFFSICSAYLFVVTCVIINRNDVLSLIAVIIAGLITTISATRMQHGLVDFAAQGTAITCGVFTSASLPTRAQHRVRSQRVQRSTIFLSLPTQMDGEGSLEVVNLEAI